MKKNIHNYERVARVIGGAALSSLAFRSPGKKWLLAFLVPVVEGILGKCALCSLLGISTRSEDKKVEDQANDYFPVQSQSERAAGHPIVGVS